jgi:hypothetical protein
MAASCGSSNLSLSGVSIRKEKDNYIFHEKIFPPLTLERILNITSEKQLPQFPSPVFWIRIRIGSEFNLVSGFDPGR